MKTTTLTPAQLAELQTCFQRINDILGLSLTIAGSSPSAVRRTSRCAHKRPACTTTETFSYRWLSTAPQRIGLLYQRLLYAKWVAPDTKPDEFSALFEGKPSMARIRWLGPKSCLVHLFRLLTDRQYVTIPKNTGRWMIVASHFADTGGCTLTHLNSQRIPRKAHPAIDRLAELLNAASR